MNRFRDELAYLLAQYSPDLEVRVVAACELFKEGYYPSIGAVSRALTVPNEAKVLGQLRQGIPLGFLLLDHGNEHDADASRRDRGQLLSLLPASYRKESGDLAAVCRHVTACVEKELDLERLTSIHDWLWVAGLPLPPRALHNQLLLGREIFDGHASRLDDG
ncbi:hypothetical protein HIM_09284 [Hirsutella minnesotensis 3608]|uniref:Uncharacterized protein n=1 Tax=Hirsutella minnesotensis 3608 TaxID=1043627 RepID=A0A0F7ZSH0_9HYPO|nr:hypothetical protein HIM_09284 [Hirsutella minnesotensis 3608]